MGFQPSKIRVVYDIAIPTLMNHYMILWYVLWNQHGPTKISSSAKIHFHFGNTGAGVSYFFLKSWIATEHPPTARPLDTIMSDSQWWSLRNRHWFFTPPFLRMDKEQFLIPPECKIPSPHIRGWLRGLSRDFPFNQAVEGRSITCWWFGPWLLFFNILGMSSSQLTSSYFSEGLVYHQPGVYFPFRSYPLVN